MGTKREKLDKLWLQEISVHLAIVFRLSNWHWTRPDGSCGIPSPKEIASYIEKTWLEYDIEVSSGGLTIGADDCGNPVVIFSKSIEFRYHGGDPYWC